METFLEFLQKIDDPVQRDRTEEVLTWVARMYPNLKPEIKWNQPMFTDHGTYIIGFSVAKQHMAVAPEQVVIERFSDDIVQAGYDYTKQLIRIRWDRTVDFSLLENIIAFNIADKAECTSFWRK